MNVTPTTYTVADYCQLYERGEITVNRSYQRSDKVWPQQARSYLIESILLGFPLPKFTLNQVTDLRSKKTIKEIVDGQQRTMAIWDFYGDRLTLASSLKTQSIAGKTYSELDDEDQGKFLSATLTIDLLVSADKGEVREAFRRMNSYTIPLNAEEHRHAFFQGPFKWFINDVASKFERSFLRTGIFTEKQLVRMADTKLMAEACDAFVNGIRTTNKTILDRLYRERDGSFPEEDELRRRLMSTLDIVGSWSELHESNLMKPYLVYSLVLALSHVVEPCAAFSPLFSSPGSREVQTEFSARNLLLLSEALEGTEGTEAYREFVEACESKTNVKAQREARFRWLCKALTDERL